MHRIRSIFWTIYVCWCLHICNQNCPCKWQFTQKQKETTNGILRNETNNIVKYHKRPTHRMKAWKKSNVKDSHMDDCAAFVIFVRRTIWACVCCMCINKWTIMCLINELYTRNNMPWRYILEDTQTNLVFIRYEYTFCVFVFTYNGCCCCRPPSQATAPLCSSTAFSMLMLLTVHYYYILELRNAFLNSTCGCNMFVQTKYTCTRTTRTSRTHFYQKKFSIVCVWVWMRDLSLRA